MEKLIHTPADVEHLLAHFERTFDMSSEEFYEARCAGEELDVPPFQQHVWASMYRDARRLRSSNGDFASRAERALELA